MGRPTPLDPDDISEEDCIRIVKKHVDLLLDRHGMGMHQLLEALRDRGVRGNINHLTFGTLKKLAKPHIYQSYLNFGPRSSVNEMLEGEDFDAVNAILGPDTGARIRSFWWGEDFEEENSDYTTENGVKVSFF